jgi:hypothetical protein
MNPMSGYRGAAGGNINRRPAGSFSGDKTPKGYELGQIQQFTPEMMELFSQLFGHVGEGSYLSKLSSGDQSLFEQEEAPAWRQFQEAQGQLGSRFSQLDPGAMSAQRGSGFQNSAGQQASDFAMQLRGQRQGLQRQGLQDLMQFSQMLLGQRPYERGLFEKPQRQMSTASQFGLGALKSAGDIGSVFFGG